MVTEVREFYKVEVNIKATSINVDNLEFEFYKLELYREDDDSLIEIKDRRVIFEPIRTSSGAKISIFILNEGDDYEDRIDYLIDEEYEIENIKLKIFNKTNESTYEYSINHLIGEQLEKEVEIEISNCLKNAIDFISNDIESKDLRNYIYNVMINNNEIIDIVNNISEIDTI